MPYADFSAVVALCWLAFVFYWIANLFNAKPTVERQSRLARFWVAFSMVVAVFFLEGFWNVAPLNVQFIPHSTLVGFLGALCAVAGVAIAIWARRTLGRNWSGQVTFKKDHELITRGPYQYVRHPIYTGLLLLALGWALVFGRVDGFVAVVVFAIGFIVKYKSEEKMMLKHFPTQYPAYMKKVRALLPGIF